MAIVKFTQDDTQPFGTGIFTNDAGRSIYTTDADTARTLPPTPEPPSADDDEPPAPPGTTISYAGDASSPYANALASNDGATGSAAGATPPAPAAAVAKVAQVVPPPGIAAPTDDGPPASIARSPEKLVDHVSSVVPPQPISKTSTTTVNGRSKAGVEKQIGTDQAGLDAYGNTLQKTAADADARAAASIDSQVDTKANQRVDLLLEQQRQQDVQAKTDAEVTRLQDLPDGKLDPDRFVNSLSTGSKIGLAVLAAISGFAAGANNAVTHSNSMDPNAVLGILTHRIDQDIEVQKDQLASGRIRKNNLIARAMAKGADAKQAESVARGQLWSLANDIGTLQAQKLGLQGAQAAAAQNTLGAMQFQATQHYGDLRAQTEARVQTTNERETGKPGAVGTALEQAIKLREGGASDAQIQQLGLPLPMGQSKEERAAAVKAGERSEGQAKAASVATSAQPYATSLGLVQDPKTGKFAAPAGHEDDSIPDSIGSRMLDAAAGDSSARQAFAKQHNAIKTARTRAAQAIVSATGGGMKLGEAEDLIGGDTLGEIADNLNAQLSSVNDLRNPTERTAAPAGASALGFKPVTK